MPGFYRQFSVLTIRHRLPAGGERCLKRGWKQIFVDGLGGNAVNARSQSFTGDKVVGGVRDVHGDGLRRGERTEDRDDGEKGDRNFHANASRSETGIKTIQLYGLWASRTSSFRV